MAVTEKKRFQAHKSNVAKRKVTLKTLTGDFMPLEGDFPSVITGGQGRGPLLHTLVAMDQRSHAVSVHEEDSSGLPSELVGIDMFPIQTYIEPWQLLH